MTHDPIFPYILRYVNLSDIWTKNKKKHKTKKYRQTLKTKKNCLSNKNNYKAWVYIYINKLRIFLCRKMHFFCENCIKSDWLENFLYKIDIILCIQTI